MRLLKTYGAAMLLLFLSSGLSGQEYRMGVEYGQKLIKHLYADGKFEVRNLQQEASTFNSMVQLGFSYELFDDLKLSTAVRYGLGENDPDDEEFEGDYSSKWRYTGDIKYKTKRFDNDIRFDQRFRYQLVAEPGDESKNYLRYQAKADYKLTNNVRPFVGIEPFYSLTNSKVSALRLYTGGNFEVFKNEIELYLIAEVLNKKSGLQTNYIMGIAYKF